MGASASSLKADVPCTRVGSAAQPTARESAGLVPLDQSRVLLFGGGSEGAEGAVQFNDLHVLDLDGKSWAPVAATGTPPSPRTGHATLAVHDNTGVKVAVLGGCSQTEGYVSDVHVLDVATWSWSQPTAHGARPSPRDKFTAVVWDRKLYTFGGFGPGLSGDDESVEEEEEEQEQEEEEQGEGTSFTWFDDVHVLDLASMTWTRVETTGTGPSARAAHGGCVVGERLVVFGGRDAQGRQGDTWTLDLTSLVWQRQGEQHAAPAGRSFHTLVALPGAVPAALSFGGMSTDGGALKHTLEVLDMRDFRWRTIDGSTADWPSKRCSVAAATAGHKLVLFGGAAHWDADDGRFLNDTYVMDLAPIMATLAAVDPNAAAPSAVDA